MLEDVIAGFSTGNGKKPACLAVAMVLPIPL